MSRFARSTTGAFLLSILIGVLSSLATLILMLCTARAQPLNGLDVVAVPPFAPPSWDDFLGHSLLAVGFVGIAVRILREVAPTTLAPAPSTRTSNNLTLLASLLIGIAFGLMHFGVQIIPGDVGWILGGFGIGGLAYTAAGALPPGLRGDTVGRVGAQAKVDVPPEAPVVPPSAP